MLCRNVASVDVEDYYHVEAFSSIVDRSAWANFESRVEANTRTVLDVFDECRVKGTFFILGWVADRHPALVREIVARGHEPACHSYWHRLIFKLSPEEFREDTLRAKATIEQACGKPVFGYRAPSFSITRQSNWAPEILIEAGFRYDSSVFPVHHDTYGVPDAPRLPFEIQTPSGTILEYPMPTFRMVGKSNLPFGGGGYLRMFPFWYTRQGLQRAKTEGLPVISYVHPWEFDPAQPRFNARWKSRLRHYTNLGKMRERFKNLLQMADFSSFAENGLDRGSANLEKLKL